MVFPQKGILLCNILFLFNKHIMDSSSCLVPHDLNLIISKKHGYLKGQFVLIFILPVRRAQLGSAEESDVILGL